MDIMNYNGSARGEDKAHSQKRSGDAVSRPRFSVADLYEAAGQSGALPSAIKPLERATTLWGPAFTVSLPPANNLRLHQAIAEAPPGSVLSVSTQGLHEAGYWGEIMTHAAIQRGLAGLVIDGCVRDGPALRRLGFPVFCRGQCVGATTKDATGGGSLNEGIQIGEARIQPGDRVAGDEDGVVVIARTALPEVLERARLRQEWEAQAIDAIRSGKTTLEIFGWTLAEHKERDLP